MSDEIIKAKKDTLFESIKVGKAIYDAFNAQFTKTYMINGDTILNWEKKFKIVIGKSLSPSEYRDLNSKLSELHHESSFYKATADAVVHAIKKGVATQYKQKFNTIVNEYKSTGLKLPANATLEQMAKIDTDDLDASLIAAEMASQFWVGIIKHLDYDRKIIETSTITLATEAKFAGKN
ncbi:MAG TPA: hypothetical protein VMX17_01575 [Candidatus Glassbacteria bacterium]|nr:hypothetical protein [Candidatus Glassbacteria bacterium]